MIERGGGPTGWSMGLGGTFRVGNGSAGAPPPAAGPAAAVAPVAAPDRMLARRR